jgi:tetratricopeptide (TPR) repeat protein
MFAEAVADTEKMGPVTSAPAYWSWLALIYGRSGQIARSRHALDELRRSITNQPVDAISVAWAYLGVGDNDQALAWFEKAYAQHSTELTSLKVNPGYDPLRGDPRFQDLLKRVRLAQ